MARERVMVSCPEDLIARARTAGISPSALFQDALRLTLQDRRRRLPSQILAADQKRRLKEAGRALVAV